MKHYSEDTIAAIATPLGEAGIGIVRISGPRACMIADSVFIPKGNQKPSRSGAYTIRYGWIIDPRRSDRWPEAGSQHRGIARRREVIDEVLVTVMRAPKTYTREDIVEINCHGGNITLKRVLELVLAQGARMAEPGEFTKRAFLNGRIDLAQAEAVADIVKAKTEASLRMAVDQLEGVLSKDINTLIDELIDIESRIEAAIDFPEEDIERIDDGSLVGHLKGIIRSVDMLIGSADRGIIAREGILAIICGRPNVGKSSLMNVLLKKDRVIVTPIPGTTRDAVEELISVAGVPIRLVDTAGIAETDDLLGVEGSRVAKKYIDRADVALFVLDSHERLTVEDRQIAALLKDKKKKWIVALNKIDLPREIDTADIQALGSPDRVVRISARDRVGIDGLERAIVELFWSGAAPDREGVMITHIRHKEALGEAKRFLESAVEQIAVHGAAELASVDIREALYHVGLIVGRSITDDILAKIFETFCIGK